MYLKFESNIFCLLLIAFLYIFKERSFQEQSRESKKLYSFSFASVFFSILSDTVKHELMQNLCFVLCGLGGFTAMYFGCKYACNTKMIFKKVLFAILCLVFGVLSFYSVKYGINIMSFLLVFVIVVLFAAEQDNKIRLDNLTKLYNRYGMDIELKEQLKQYEREHSDSFYIIACDIDNFKHINDTWGHPEGDRALVLVAGALSKVAKKFDSEVFRIGGDEFIIITDKSQQGLDEEITKAIQNELDKIEFRDDFDINMSIGTALYDGVTSIDDLLNNADKKLYEVKRRR